MHWQGLGGGHWRKAGLLDRYHSGRAVKLELSAEKDG